MKIRTNSERKLGVERVPGYRYHTFDRIHVYMCTYKDKNTLEFSKQVAEQSGSGLTLTVALSKRVK